ncbi:MAG: sensor histidine kinase [Geminicoccaceae bacterium]
MRRIAPFKSATFRLALASSGLFALFFVIVLLFLFGTAGKNMTRPVGEIIAADLHGLGDQYQLGGVRRLERVIERRSARRPDRGAIYLLTEPDGLPIAGNIDRLPSARSRRDGFIRFTIETQPDGEHRAEHRALGKVFRLRTGEFLLVGRDVEPIMQGRDRVRRAILSALGFTLILSVIGGYLMSRQLTRRIEAINTTTQRIIEGDLSQRIATIGNADEFDRLGNNLNTMLDRIEQLLTSMRQVSDDVAHDLRTPLTRMRTRLELALIGDKSDAELRQALDESLSDAERMIATFNALLAIARTEAGSDDQALAPVDLATILRDAVELYAPLAEEKGLQLERACVDGQCIVGNAALLSQAFANLLDNAVKYTPEGGRIEVLCEAAADGPRVTIADSGPGIPAEERERVLERFVRLERERGTSGNGLGLSLVRAIAQRHRAKLVLGDNQPGLRVTIDFPRA